jgi:selenide,water dikinase
LLDGALELAAAGMLTSGDKTNRAYVGDDIDIVASVSADVLKLLFDPQTAGGMLIAVPENRAEVVLVRLRQNYPTAKVIGKVKEHGTRSIVIRD